MRKKTRVVKIGNVEIGGDNPIRVQSMCSTKTSDVKATINQIKELEKAGCEIIRVAVPDMESAKALKEIKENISIPLVADIHFDYRLALESVKYVDKLRLNPGNIGDKEQIKQVVDAAKARKIPIRIGINSGSLEKELVYKYGNTAKAMVESALKHIKILEELDFFDIIIAVKASDIQRTVEAYRLLSEKVDYPLHVGVTEAGTSFSGMIKSAIGIGALLLDGIGDTIRVSLTSDVVEEVKAGYEILKALELRIESPIVVSCPTCGRTDIDLISLAKKVEERLKDIKKPIKVAVMGCSVNGPGEAKDADIGVCGGKGMGVIIKKGKVIKKVKEEELLEELMKEIKAMEDE